jgi:cysteinyl-tRNA synthetase
LEEKGYDALDYRFFCLGGHYRSQLVFSWSSMDGAKNGRRSLMRHIKSLRSEDENLNVELSKKGHQYLEEFNKHVRNDLNTPRALAVVWTFLQDKELSNDEKLTLIGEVDKIFALDLLKDQSENLEIDQEVLDLVEQRRVAKQQKNYPLADKLRDIVENKGYQLKDTPSGTEVSKKV